MWQKRLGERGTPDKGHDVKATPSGGLVVVGTTSSYGAGGEDLWALELDGDGQIQWQYTIGDTGRETGGGVFPLDDGTVVVAGTTDRGGVVEDRIWAANLDPSGLLVWNTVWEDGGGALVEALVESPYEQTLLLGTLYLEPSWVWGWSGFALHIDDQGERTFSYIYGNGTGDRFTGVAQAIDYGFEDVLLAVGHTTATPDENTDLWLRTVSQYAREDWSVQYGGSGMERSAGIIPAPGSGYLVAGTTSGAGSGLDDLWLLRVDDRARIDSGCPFAEDDVLDDRLETLANALHPDVTVGASNARTFNTVLTPTPVALAAAEQCAGCQPDPREEDDRCEWGPVLGWGDLFGNNFCDDRVDWARVNTCAGAEYIFEARNLGREGDPVLELWDPGCGSALLIDDNGGGGVDASITWTAPDTDIYFLRVTQADGGWGHDRAYELLLNGAACDRNLWWRLYGDILLEPVFESVEAVPDGGFIATGSLTPSADPDQAGVWVLLGDVRGDVRWQRHFRSEGWRAQGRKVIRLNDGQFAVAGDLSQPGVPGTSGAWLARIDAGGDLVWQRTLENQFTQIGEDLVQTSDGNLVLAGSSATQDRDFDYYAAKVDGSGALLWQASIGTILEERLKGVVETTDGGLVLAGQAGGSGNADILWVVKLDAGGNLLWEQAITQTDLDSVEAVAATGDGGVIVAARRRDWDLTQRIAWLVKLDAAGGIAWQRRYTGGQFVNVEPYSLLSLPGGEVVVTGVMDARAGVLVLAPNGQVDWFRTYGRRSNTSAWEAKAAPDGSLLVAGRHRGSSTAAWRASMMRIDASGEIAPACQDIRESTVTLAFTSDTASPTGAVVVSPGFSESSASLEASLNPPQYDEICANEGLTGPCAPLLPSIDDVQPGRDVCDGQEVTFTGSATGEGAIILEWDLDYDGALFVADASGPTAATTYPSIGSYVAALQATDSCPTPGPQVRLRTADITVHPDPSPTITEACDEGNIILDAGAGYASYSWDGGETTRTLNVGADTSTQRSVTVTDVYGCSGSAAITPSLACVPGVVSDVPTGAPPLRVFRGPGPSVQCEMLSGATAYNVHVDAIGSWYSPGVAMGTTCSVSSWTDNGDGTIGLDVTVPAGTWIVVTASNASGEGLAGPDSGGVERTIQGAWEFCGPWP